jgi:hypothetical protein
MARAFALAGPLERSVTIPLDTLHTIQSYYGVQEFEDSSGRQFHGSQRSMEAPTPRSA